MLFAPNSRDKCRPRRHARRARRSTAVGAVAGLAHGRAVRFGRGTRCVGSVHRRASPCASLKLLDDLEGVEFNPFARIIHDMLGRGRTRNGFTQRPPRQGTENTETFSLSVHSVPRGCGVSPVDRLRALCVKPPFTGLSERLWTARVRVQVPDKTQNPEARKGALGSYLYGTHY